MAAEKITVETLVNTSVAMAWSAYVTPDDIKQWNTASDDWHTTRASVDLRVGGEFTSRMEAKDGSFGFDFTGTYTKIVPQKLIEYSFGDRAGAVEFVAGTNGVTVRVTFDAESQNPVEQQRQGWQAILNNFAKHAERNGHVEKNENDEAEIRSLIARWSKAVREQDHAAIRANHHADILMFDVPPPFMSQGLDAYMATWELFFSCAEKPVAFDFDDVRVTCGRDVAFVTAVGRCTSINPSGQQEPLEFRLTMGLRKIDGAWCILHEHHSLPAKP